MTLAEGLWIPGRDPSEYRKRSAEAERMHPLDVPGHGDEAPLAADAIEPAQQELAESHHRFDDAEHRLGAGAGWRQGANGRDYFARAPTAASNISRSLP